MPGWLLVTLPSLALALGLAFGVPRFESLESLLVTLCIPAAMLYGTPALLLRILHQHPPPPAALAESLYLPGGGSSESACAADAKAHPSSDAPGPGKALAAAEVGSSGGYEAGAPRARVVVECVRSLAHGWECWLMLGVALGVGLALVVFVEVVYTVFYVTDYSGDFFCSVVGASR